MSDIVGFIGLGTMGMPMTANLAKADVALVVHDASPSATAAAGSSQVSRWRPPPRRSRHGPP